VRKRFRAGGCGRRSAAGVSCGVAARAHAKALTDGFRGTDDGVLVERLGYPVRLVPGSPDNLKVTTMADLAQAEQILRGRLTHET